MAPTSGREPARARLAELMDQRRRELQPKLTWDQVALKAGIHRETLRQIRNGTSTDIRPLSAAGIEDALGWKHGSIDAILAGGEPTPIGEAEPDRFSEGIATANAVLDAVEQDPKLRDRLRKILSAGSGHRSDVNDSATEGDSGDEAAG
jgi:hypothetical protein